MDKTKPLVLSSFRLYGFRALVRYIHREFALAN